jgi:hypothetical protein
MILPYVVVLPATLIACEVACRLPLGRVLAILRKTPRKVARVIGSSRISDEWKEKFLPRYACRILSASLLLFACLIAVAAPVLLGAVAVTGSVASGSALLLQPAVLLEMVVSGAGYVMLRRHLHG